VENQIPSQSTPASEAQPAPRSSAPAAPVNTVTPAPRTNPPPSSTSVVLPAIANSAPQEKPQGVVQTLVPQATRPVAPPPEKTPSERPAPPPPAPVNRSTTAAAPPPVSKPAAPAPQPVRTEPSLSGRWVYSPASKSGSAYPPESVTLMLAEAYNQVNGTFAGRYKVPKNGKLNPKVNFSFEGPLRPGSSKFSFTAPDGMKGEIELIRLPGKQNAIEVVWYSERDKLTFDDIFFRAP
jgi:hypothetical protein